MKFNYIFSVLALGSVVYLSPADAQTTKQQPKKTTTTAKKQATVKPAAVKQAAKPKTTAQKLGDLAAKSAAKDTTKKGGANTPANPNNTSTLSEEVVVTTNYKPVLADAVKIRRNPDLEDKTPFKAPLTYNLLDKRLEQNTNIKQLEAMKLPAERDSMLYNNYVKLGVGNLKSTFGEGYFSNGRDNALQVGAWVKHFGQSGSDAYKQNQSSQEVGVFGKAIGTDNTLSGRISYNRRNNYFYGYAPFTTTPVPDLNPAKQHFNTLSAEGELAKNYRDTDRVFDYALKAKGYLFSNAFKARENNVLLTGFINQTIRQFYAGLSGTVDLTSQKDVNYSLNNSLVRLNPYLKFQGDNYKIDAGVNFVSEFGMKSRLSLFPAAKLELSLIPKYIRFFAEVKGDVNKTSIRSLTEDNPFLDQNIAIKNSVDKLDIAAGLKGTLAPGLGFKAAIYSNKVKDMPLFVSNFDAQNNNRFLVLYDNGTATINGFRGELDFKASETFDLFGKVDFRDYKMNSQLEAWNMPDFNLTAGTIINITDKLRLNGSLLIRGQAKDLPYNQSSVLSLNDQRNATPYIVKSFADVSAGASYQINRQFSVFIQANNLLNTNYRQWMFYRNYGFNIFGGLAVGF
ncbi:hypothetical protein MUY27_11240 [Mucilaginibacter sp. RS28]|uniref:TonB dependent receptor n=1 Tax=Mucilaginibacter straminoryzae TaxID=2932774 RepID=A0A9X1X612_9SPHI|nr:hypothetical protein [Mucilaginibacter straminoryzae]MCJ8210283.1 hypothetical protein [Mucilaginibacter straminoryzae]